MASDYLALVEDFAPKPGASQVFPIVCPLSDEKVGPQDGRHPSELAAKYDADEREGDAWKFERDRSIAAVARLQRLKNGLSIRAEEAERAAEVVANKVAMQSVNIYWAKDDRQRQGGSTLLATSIRLQEANQLHEEAKRDCNRRLQEAKMLLESEKNHTAEVQRMLQAECQRSEAGWKRVEELTEESRKRVAARQCNTEKEAAEALQREEAAKITAQDRIREAEEKHAAQLELLRKDVAAAKKSCREGVEIEAARKAQMEEAVNANRNVTAARLDVDLQCMRHNVTDTRATCDQHVQRLAAREENTRKFYDEFKDGAVASLLDSAGAMSRESHRKEVCATRSLEHSVHTLGQHYTTMRAYNPVVDGKISKVLGGCLHGREAMVVPVVGTGTCPTSYDDERYHLKGLAMPSPRVFPPPAPLARLA